MNTRPIRRDDLPQLLALYGQLHSSDDPLPAADVVEATFNFYESAGFDRHEKQAFIAKPPL